jgi:hypothetical protein
MTIEKLKTCATAVERPKNGENSGNRQILLKLCEYNDALRDDGKQ